MLIKQKEVKAKRMKTMSGEVHNEIMSSKWTAWEEPRKS
jgi:hypothetical protein